VRACTQVFKRVGNSAIRLLLVPGIIEAFFDGGIAIAIFGMPPLFAFALGFILKAVGPALVIQCMFEVQQKRLGTQECEPRINLAPSVPESDACYCMCITACLAVLGLMKPSCRHMMYWSSHLHGCKCIGK
jgi:hypothetical protein